MVPTAVPEGAIAVPEGRTTAELSGRTAPITGGASGIGHARALAFASAGTNATIADLDGEAAQRVAYA
ncbi:hypothetical protein GCM10028798_28610 [Humibacter antri]